MVPAQHEWELLSGDPEGIAIGNPNDLDTDFQLLATGDYSLRLTAFDGELFSASEHIALAVVSGGTRIILR